MRKGVVITRGKVGANVSGSPFKVCGLLATGVDVTGTGMLDLATTYKLTSVADAEAIGLNAAYDTANNVVVYQHIVDFYDENPEGILWLRVQAQTVTLADLVDDTGLVYAKKLLIDADGAIYKLGIAWNPPATGYSETSTDGINTEVRAALDKCQALHQWSLDTFRECHIVLEGRGYGGNATTAVSLRALPATPSGIISNDKVSLVIAQDYDFAATLTGLAQKYAAVGKLLGTLSACDLNQDCGEVDSFNLTRETRNRWKTAGLSNHTKVKDSDASLDTLDSKGYIFADTYSGISGYRWNGDHVCAPITVDADGNMNEFSIKYGQVMIHATRELRKRLLPQVRKVKPYDQATGHMAPGVVKDLEARGDDVFDDFKASGWITDGKTIVDPASDIVVLQTVNASFNLVPYGTIGRINGTINLKKTL